MELEGTSLVYAEFSKTVPGMASSANIDLLRELLISLRLNFDLIILASEAALSTSLSTTLGAAVDGAVLVVEAERTRSPVIADLIEQIRAHGGRILGTVLTRRRFYIPRPIYGLFFGDHRS